MSTTLKVDTTICCAHCGVELSVRQQGNELRVFSHACPERPLIADKKLLGILRNLYWECKDHLSEDRQKSSRAMLVARRVLVIVGLEPAD